ncbi:MAG: serine/threonine-protein kinase [Proteobacteria bacterium]|nr:serine/threonine-protein kinase [Pseudomonadota bacterium]
MAKSDQAATVAERRRGQPARPAPVVELLPPGDPGALGPPSERYELGDEIARGGMGRVVDARDRLLGRRVAIKQVLDADHEGLRRFARETQIAARLEHPSIIALYDAGRADDGSPYYVMRKVAGRPLVELIDETASVADRLALLPVVLAATEAVGHAHTRGVIHRDLKPHNILVGELGETVVIDWGLAKVIGEEEAVDGEAVPELDPNTSLRTRLGVAMGTPCYMGPEQLHGEPADERSDVYALGATLYHVLTGAPPHLAETGAQIMQLAEAGPPQPLLAIAPGTPRELVALVDMALARAPEDRYASAVELAAELRRFLTGQLVAAHRYSPAARIGRFVRRHRVAVAVSTGSLVAIALVATIAVRRVVEARDLAVAGQHAAEEARAREADRADELLLAQARTVVATNPIGALTLLRKLPVGTPLWRRARAVAAHAVARGVPWVIPGPARATGLEVTRDGAVAYTAGADGAIGRHDLVARTTSELHPATGERAQLDLRDDDRTLVIARGRRLTFRELATGTETTLAIPADVRHLTTGGSVTVWTDVDHRTWVLRDPAGPATELAPHPGTELVVSPDGVHVAYFGARGTDVVALATGALRFAHHGSSFGVAWSADGTRLAIADDPGGFLVELGAVPTEHVVVNPTVRGAMFVADEPVFVATDGRPLRANQRRTIDPGGSLDVPPIASVRDGAAYTTYRDELVVVGVTATLVVALPRTPRAIAAAGTRVVVAVADHLALYELGPALPRYLPLPPSAFVVQGLLDDRRFLSTTNAAWTVFDLDGGSPQTFGELGVGRLVTFAADRSFIVVDDGARLALGRLGQPPLVLSTTARTAVATGPDRVLVVDARAVTSYAIASGTRSPVFEAATPIGAFDGAGDVAAIESGGLTLAVGAKLDAVHVAPDGRVYFAIGRVIERWDGVTREVVGHAPVPVTAFAHDGWHGVVAVDTAGDRWRIGEGVVTRMFPPRTQRASWSPGTDLAVFGTLERMIEITDLATGDHWPLMTGDGPVDVAPGGGRLVAPLFSPQGEGVAIYDLALPATGAAYERWLVGLTNLVAHEGEGVQFP